MIVRGTPGRTPCSSGGSAADLLDSSVEVSPSVAEDGVDPHH
jgi:hypothetical protein